MTSVSQITTAEELLAHASELGRCELIRGKLHMMSPAGGDHGRIAMTLGGIIRQHVIQHELGAVFAAETGFVLERNPDTVRAPDVAFIARERVAEARTPKYIPIPPDFVAEVVSPEDRRAEVRDKAQWWLGHGARLVWVVDPASQTVTVHEPDGHTHLRVEVDTLEGGDVLPGLSVHVADIFR